MFINFLMLVLTRGRHDSLTRTDKLLAIVLNAALRINTPKVGRSTSNS